MDRKKERGSGGEKEWERARMWGKKDGLGKPMGRGFRDQEVRWREGGGMGG